MEKRSEYPQKYNGHWAVLVQTDMKKLNEPYKLSFSWVHMHKWMDKANFERYAFAINEI